MGKIRLFFKWVFVFSILIIWTYFVVIGSITGNFAEGFAEGKEFIPLYMQTSAGIERAASSDLIDFLFYHNFDIENKTENIPSEDCSIRGKNGKLSVEGLSFDDNKINFYVPLKNAGKGEGYITGQKGKNRFSLKFKIKEILETNSENLKIRAEGKGNLNLKELNFNLIINFDKENNKINVDSDNSSLSASDMKVSFIDGCLNEEKSFYLFIDKGRLEKRRSIDDVRKLLSEHPELIENYENLRGLYKDYWWVTLPGGSGIVS